ncbi:Polyphenol oxidase chloroplastic [Zea mays]|uniref:Polyphenol oxidase chloroplastic n=1 Tax=Zea mays TaxID=4577 RepID=B7ZZ57_MAIZE|nr:unknown [Zea mays]AQK50299.1 Polyphenol oxidase chloroplastic [Zea mays]
MATASAASSFLVPATAIAPTPSACPSTVPKNKKNAAGRRRRTLQCRASGRRGDDEDSRLLWLPRREVLTGLGGVAASFVGYPDLASIALEANPVESCRRGEKVTEKLVECSDPNRDFPCPPASRVPIVDFTPEARVTRVRRPAHLLDPEYQEKYREAVGKMRALDGSNPLSFAAQAAVHQSYCDGHYRLDPTEKNRPFDVHFSWIFAPWHRMYIYFYERALGQLIGDDTFALPYWNWDAPAGMGIPAIFKQGVSTADNPLYDPYRNMENMDALLDLDYLKKPRRDTIPFEPPTDPAARAKYDDAVQTNLCTIYLQQVRDGKGPRAFLGEKLCSESSFRVKEINERSKRRQADGQSSKVSPSKSQSQGTLERMAHTTVHVWTGRANPATCSAEQGGVVGHDGKPHCQVDMGFLGTAGRDPLFYSHHANVDRMWHIWSTRLGGKGFDDPEWLDTSFVFYDDYRSPRLVRMKFRDVLDATRLGYTYDKESEAALPWLNSKPTRFSGGGKAKAKAAPKVASEFPLTLTDEAVDVPAVAVPARQAGKDLVLLIEGIEYDPQINNKFDVVINVAREDAARVGPKDSEYAGSFSAVPSSNAAGGTLVGKFTLALDGVLADLGLAGASAVDIVLVPHTEGEIKLYLPPTIENA